MCRRLALLLLALALANCGGSGSGAPPVRVDEQHGRIGNVGIGSTSADVRARFGAPVATEGCLPKEPEDVRGPYAFSLPAGPPSVLRYEREAFLLTNDRVFGFITSDTHALLTRGVGIGDPLARARHAYPLSCREAYAGEGAGTYILCRTRLKSGLQLVVTKDPVESIAVLR